MSGTVGQIHGAMRSTRSPRVSHRGQSLNRWVGPRLLLTIVCRAVEEVVFFPQICTWITLTQSRLKVISLLVGAVHFKMFNLLVQAALRRSKVVQALLERHIVLAVVMAH